MGLRRAIDRPLLAGLIVTVAIASAACILPAAASAAKPAPEAPFRGFDTASPGLSFQIPGGAGKDLKRARMLGANAIRLVVRWDWLEPKSGTMDASRAERMDRVMGKAQKQGLGVVATVMSTPCWASSAPRNILGGLLGGCPNAARYPPRIPATYGVFVKQVVKRWGAALSGVEVWNEPNLTSFWLGGVGDYVGLVHQANKAVNATRFRKVPVVGGSVSGADLTYIKQLLAAGISRWTDAISIHPYDIQFLTTGFGDPSVVRLDDNWSFAWAVPQVHALMTSSGNQDPIWITEFGYADCPATPYCVAPALQADYLSKAVRLAATWPYVDTFLLYRLRDWGITGGSTEAHFGVLQKDGQPKPAAQAVADAFKSLR